MARPGTSKTHWHMRHVRKAWTRHSRKFGLWWGPPSGSNVEVFEVMSNSVLRNSNLVYREEVGIEEEDKTIQWIGWRTHHVGLSNESSKWDRCPEILSYWEWLMSLWTPWTWLCTFMDLLSGQYVDCSLDVQLILLLINKSRKENL